MDRFSKKMWGLVLIIVGCFWATNVLGITKINVFFDGWWTLFIIIPSLSGVINAKDKTSPMTGLIIGVVFLLACQGIINFQLIWNLMLPIILVLLGISMLFKDAFKKNKRKDTKNDNNINQGTNTDSRKYSAVFGAQDVKIDNLDFSKCSLTAIFGGINMNFINTIITHDCVIKCNVAFGGIDIYVPDNVNIKVNATPVFGGVSDCRKNKNEVMGKTINIDAFCIFGGVDIKDISDMR